MRRYDGHGGAAAAPAASIRKLYLRAAPFSREKLNYGGKVVMPQSILKRFMQRGRLDETPLQFSLVRPTDASTKVYCGVIEFTAPEGRIKVPQWMLDVIDAEYGDILLVTPETLQKATYIKIQPERTAFIDDIVDPKTALEAHMRMFTTLASGTRIPIAHAGTVYWVSILESRPASAVLVHNVDMSVDFAAPLDYVEPPRQVRKKNDSDSILGKRRGKGMSISREVTKKMKRLGTGEYGGKRRGKARAPPTSAAIGGESGSAGEFSETDSGSGSGAEDSSSEAEASQSFVPFSGNGASLADSSVVKAGSGARVGGSDGSDSDNDDAQDVPSFKAFSGAGRSLRS